VGYNNYEVLTSLCRMSEAQFIWISVKECCRLSSAVVLSGTNIHLIDITFGSVGLIASLCPKYDGATWRTASGLLAVVAEPKTCHWTRLWASPIHLSVLFLKLQRFTVLSRGILGWGCISLWPPLRLLFWTVVWVPHWWGVYTDRPSRDAAILVSAAVSGPRVSRTKKYDAHL
jgi:hypothetical protein